MASIKPPGPLDFVRSGECWPEWKRRFQRYRSASGMTEHNVNRQVDTLIYIMGEEAEYIHTKLIIPDARDGADTLYDRTLRAFDTYFMPRANTLHHSIMFTSRSQKQGESNEQYNGSCMRWPVWG